MTFDGAGNDVPLADLDLLLFYVARETYDFHAVEQRDRDGVKCIGRGDEHDLREVKGKVQIMVPEINV